MKPGGALVTGAGLRLGRAMAEALGADGWAVAIHYRGSKAGAEEAAATIRKAGGLFIADDALEILETCVVRLYGAASLGRGRAGSTNRDDVASGRDVQSLHGRGPGRTVPRRSERLEAPDLFSLQSRIDALEPAAMSAPSRRARLAATFRRALEAEIRFHDAAYED